MLAAKEVIQLSFIGASVTILSIRCIPALQNRLLSYGARISIKNPKQQADSKATSSGTETKATLDILSAPQVPHDWFASFYVALLASLLFWATQIALRGPAYSFLVERSDQNEAPMTQQQMLVMFMMAFAQGARRLYESLVLKKQSSATMHVTHWIMGILFYLGVSVSIWIEGIPELERTGIQAEHFRFDAPSLRTFLTTLVFILASGLQHDCHAYLASLKRYSVPQHPAFHLLVCPHYFAECMIYVAFAVAAAPKGALFNQTMLCALFFVVVNLGVTADGTKSWYISKFGSESVRGKARMIPFIY